ncbi:MAG: hypothetical protein JXA19_01140 [Anaerolineales bacterium]|nr:hypothetical protein [Anaerolineales bacterium]
MPNRQPSRGGASPRNIPVRRTASIPKRSTPVSPQRTQARTARREAVRQNITRASSAPRPQVRPANPPQRVMPKTARIPASRQSSNTTRQASRVPAPRPSSRPSTQAVTRRPSFGTMTAAAVGGAALVALNTSRAHPDIQMNVSSLENDLGSLQSGVTYNDVFEDIAEIDNKIDRVLNLLESARDKGYRYQADLETIVYDAASRWQEVRGEVEQKARTESAQWQKRIPGVNQQITQLNNSLHLANSSGLVSTTKNSVNSLLSDIQNAQRALENYYSSIQTNINSVNSRLTEIHWAVTQLEEASFQLDKNENLVMAVSARWDKEGKDDPEGVIFLSNERFIFEQKEKIATKKVLFVATEKELVQGILIDQKVADIVDVKGKGKGIFGHQDYINLDFKDKSLGQVAIHLQGQASEKWIQWITLVKTGKIKEDIALESGISFGDLTGKLTSADIVSVQKEVNDLQDDAMLKSLKEEISEVENNLSLLERDLGALRNRGYVVEKGLEADLQILSIQWGLVKERAQQTIEFQAKMLADLMKDVQIKMANLASKSSNLSAARPQYVELKSTMASVEAQVAAAEDTVLNQYEDFADEIELLDTHLDWVDWMLDALEQAGFKLLATESAVAAVEAVWVRPGLEEENGIAFLTDQRFLWEDRVGEFELKFDVPVSKVGDVKVSEDESGHELLVISFAGGQAPVSKTTFRLASPIGEEWQQMINRAQSGSYTEDRVVELDEAELDRIRNAPSQCATCGASFTAPILRGQTEIICEFCGTSTRI